MGMGQGIESFQKSQLMLCEDNDERARVAPQLSETSRVLARFLGTVVGAHLTDPESGKAEYTIRPEDGIPLRYQVDGSWQEAYSELRLHHEDLLELEGRWHIRYYNEQVRTRTEA